MELRNKKILIVGIARSGIGSAKLCYQLGAKVALYDGKEREVFNDLLKDLEAFPFDYYFGDFNSKILEHVDYMVLSPGVPTDLHFIQLAKELQIEVIGEIELAYAFCKAPILAITGTNGKTTTTSLVGEILKKYNPLTDIVGNIGNPFTNIVLETKKEGIVVAEISSFQLETIKEFKPKVSAILNLSEDHLNRHKTFENYVHAKLRIAENQDVKDFCVLNYDDLICRDLSHRIKARSVWFSMKEEVEGVFLKDNKLMARFNKIAQEIIPIEDVKLLGTHNIENVLASIAIALCAEVPVNIIRECVSAFKGVEHRIEFSGEVGGVKYYNDSKATNPDAAIKGIKAMITPTVLIAGGMDKGSTYDEWINAFEDRVKALVLYGETKYKIEMAARNLGYSNIYIVNDLEEAVKKADEIAREGDSVLLSPACASWDMFKSFEERGDLFKKLISTLSV